MLNITAQTYQYGVDSFKISALKLGEPIVIEWNEWAEIHPY